MAQESGRLPMRTVWTGTLLMLLVTLLSAGLTSGRPATPALVLGAAAIAEIGTLAMAALMAASSPYPRAAFFAVAVGSASMLLLSTAVVPPEVWMREVRPVVWLLPWSFLAIPTVAWRRGGACASAGAGWMLVGSGIAIGALPLAVALLAHAR